MATCSIVSFKCSQFFCVYALHCYTGYITFYILQRWILLGFNNLNLRDFIPVQRPGLFLQESSIMAPVLALIGTSKVLCSDIHFVRLSFLSSGVFLYSSVCVLQTPKFVLLFKYSLPLCYSFIL